MGVIKSQIKTSSEEFRQNDEANRALNEDLSEKLEAIRKGGSETSHLRHRDQGKLFVRDRIALLIDEGTPFLEICALAGYEFYDAAVPAGGLVEIRQLPAVPLHEEGRQVCENRAGGFGLDA